MTILVLGGGPLAAAFARRAGVRRKLLILSRAPEPEALPAERRRIDDFAHLPAECFKDVTSVVNCIDRDAAEFRDLPLRTVYVEIPSCAARQALDAGIRHFVHVSSLSVFGSAVQIDESTPLKPSTDYGRCRLEAEHRLDGMRAEGLEPSLVRVPMVYGRGVSSKLGHLAKLMDRFGWFVGAASRPRRSLLHVANAAAALEHVVISRTVGAVYACDREPFEIGILAEILARHRDRPVHIVRVADTLLAPLGLLSPSIHASLFRESIVADRLNLCQNIDIPTTLRQGLQEVLENIGRP